jgi:hypothetical protein
VKFDLVIGFVGNNAHVAQSIMKYLTHLIPIKSIQKIIIDGQLQSAFDMNSELDIIVIVHKKHLNCMTMKNQFSFGQWRK